MDWSAIVLSLRLATATTLILLVVGLPLAGWLALSHRRGRWAVDALVALPLVLPPTVLGFYVLVALGPRSPLGRAYEAITGSPIVFSFQGLLVASVLYSLPFAVQPFAAAFAAVDRNLIETAWCLGASRVRTFTRIVVPLARPGNHRGRGLELRAHRRRVRRRADGRRQSCRDDAHRLDLDLRRRAGVQLRAGRTNGSAPARVLVRRARHDLPPAAALRTGMAVRLVASFLRRHAPGVSIRADLELDAGDNRVTVLFGPSGSGKTTILRCLAGLDRPQEGFIRFGDEVWFDARGQDRPPAAAAPARVRLAGLRSLSAPHRRAEHSIRDGRRGTAGTAIASTQSCERSISMAWPGGSQANCRAESGSASPWHARWREIHN